LANNNLAVANEAIYLKGKETVVGYYLLAKNISAKMLICQEIIL
jgi:hypothetical protein